MICPYCKASMTRVAGFLHTYICVNRFRDGLALRTCGSSIVALEIK